MDADDVPVLRGFCQRYTHQVYRKSPSTGTTYLAGRNGACPFFDDLPVLFSRRGATLGDRIVKPNRLRPGIFSFFFLLAVTPFAFGDSVCNKGIRDITAAERTQMTNVLKAAQSALPPAPEGWIIVEDTSHELSVPGTICGDIEKQPWNYDLARTYRNIANPEAREKIMMDMAARQRAAMQERQPRLEAVQAKMQTIMQQQIALNQKRDYAGAEKLQPQLVAAEKEYEKLINEANDPAAMAAADKEFNKDREMFINVRVNPRSENVGPGAQAFAPPAGGKSAQRWHVEDENESKSNDHALYLFGAWQPGEAGRWQQMARPGAPPPAAHGVAVYVRGDPARVTQTVAKIDFAKFAASVK